jgi:hypothetical protein
MRSALLCCAVLCRCGVCSHIACAEGAFSVAQWLIESGVDPNPRDRHDRTPLEVQTGWHRSRPGILHMRQ